MKILWKDMNTSGKDHIEYCSIKIDDICFISVYNSPNSSFAVLKKYLHEVISISTQIQRQDNYCW